MSRELELDVGPVGQDYARLMNAVDAASSQDQITWLTENGKRVAAVVPVDVAEAHEAAIAEVLHTKIGSRVQFPDVTVNLSVNHSGNVGAIMATVTRAMRRAGLGERDCRNFREAVMGCESYDDVLQFVMKTVNVE
jgi:hypothetical protein